MKYVVSLSLILILAACRERAGMPQTETTGTADSVQEATTAASATTTGVTGGTSSAMTPEDKEFVSRAGMAGLAEVQMANLALQKATSADVKSFAQRMATDHSKSNEELQEFATTKGIGLPAELDGELKNTVDHLNSLSGAEFDNAYMQHMVEDHTRAVDLFTNAANKASDTDLKAWATKTLPTLQEHSRLAQTVAGKV